MYVELIRFNRGVFTKREAPFFSKKAYEAYDKVVAKFAALKDEEVLICLRHDNHGFIKSWSSVKSTPSGKELLKNAKTGKR